MLLPTDVSPLLPFIADPALASEYAGSPVPSWLPDISSTPGSELRNFDADFRAWCPADLRFEAGGETDRGGVEEDVGVTLGDEGTSAHSEAGSLFENTLVVDGSQEFLLIKSCSGFAVSGGDAVMGLGEGEGALALMDRGCNMLKIWSSDC